jgi:hypothetical protein
VVTKAVIIKGIYFGTSAHLLKSVQSVLHQSNLITGNLVDSQNDIDLSQLFH